MFDRPVKHVPLIGFSCAMLRLGMRGGYRLFYQWLNHSLAQNIHMTITRQTNKMQWQIAAHKFGQIPGNPTSLIFHSHR